MLQVREANGRVSFLVRLQPRASRTQIDGEWQGALRIRLNAPPVEGRANEALCRFLADCLNVPLAAVKIASGERNRLKRVEVQGVKPEQVRAIAFVGGARESATNRQKQVGK
jgi:uncharacterized protein (TIGR00251 family)